MKEFTEPAAGERVDISILRGEQSRLTFVAVAARRIEEMESSVVAEAAVPNIPIALAYVVDILNAWREFGVLGVSSEVHRLPLIWTQIDSDEIDA